MYTINPKSEHTAMAELRSKAISAGLEITADEIWTALSKKYKKEDPSRIKKYLTLMRNILRSVKKY